MVDATSADDESVVGEECHIVSRKGQGPRHDPAFRTDYLDELENLMLLCRTHHKMVDDQHETYTAEVLLKLKANHEKWVSLTLTEEKQLQPVRIRRIKENIPPFLVRLTSGGDIMKIVGDASASSFEHVELHSEAEVDLVGHFLQEAQDYGEMWSDMEAAARVKATFKMTSLLHELEQAGFCVFGD